MRPGSFKQKLLVVFQKSFEIIFLNGTLLKSVFLKLLVFYTPAILFLYSSSASSNRSFEFTAPGALCDG